MNKEKHAAVNFRTYKGIAGLFLAITSVIVTYPYGLKIMGPLLGEWAPYGAVVISALLYFMIDKPMAQGLDYLEKTAGHGLTWRFWAWDNRQAKKAIVISLTVFALGMTGGMSFISSYLISNTIAPPPDRDKLEVARQRNQDSFDKVLAELNADIAKAEAAIPKAKRDGHRGVEAAIRSGSSNWQKDYRSNNDWFKKQGGRIKRYIARIEKAKADSVAMVGDHTAALSALTMQKTEHLSGAGEINESTDKAFFADSRRVEAMFNSYWKFMFMADIAAVFFLVVFHIFLVLHMRAGGVLPEAKHSFSVAFSEWKNDLWDRFVDWLFRRKNPDANPTENPDETPTFPAPKYAPVRGTDHDEIPVGRVLRMIEAQGEQIQALSDVVVDLKRGTDMRPMDGKPSGAIPTEIPTEKRRRKRRVAARKSDGKRTCLECGTDISARKKGAKFCSDAHRKNWNEKHSKVK